VAVPPKVMLAGVALAPRKFCEKVKGTYLERRAVASYTQWEIALGPAAKVGKAQIFTSARESVVPRSK